jgi:hypothetical protein
MLKNSLLFLGGAACGVVIMLGTAASQSPRGVEMISGPDKDGVIVWHLRNGRVRSCLGKPPYKDGVEAPKCGPWSEEWPTTGQDLTTIRKWFEGNGL